MADNIKVRTAVGVCLIAAFGGLLAADHATGRGWGAVALAAALMAAGMREYCAMARVAGPLPGGLLVVAAAGWALLKGWAWQVDPRLHHAEAPAAIGLAYALFFAALRGAPSVERFQGLMAAAFGFFYVPFLGGFALDARFAIPDMGEAAFFYVIAVAKGSDICAYFCGKALGRTKVVPSVSPGKTQAGFVGAVLGGAVITCLFSQFSALGRLVPLPLAPGVGIVMALVVISGDLIESFMKRAVATKDSAHLLPGYGGILDVVDSVIITAPVVHFGLLFLEKARPLAEAALDLRSNDEALVLFGPNDRTLRALRERFGVDVVLRGLRVVVRGEKAEPAASALGELLGQARANGALPPAAVDALLGAPTKPGNGGASARLSIPTLTSVTPVPDPTEDPSLAGDEPRAIEGVRLKTAGQRKYVKAIRDNGLVIAVGPAGTGKTFLAVLMAVQALKAGEVTRIVLCRPAVEAGEKLGFLPGDYQAKVNPYMRPLYDALHALLDFDTVKRYIEREVVEVAPLAYMRGRTLSSSFIILDEAQNTTKAQMKMLLTRMGEGSKIVVTGDTTQIDLPSGTTSGLVHAQAILRGVDGIAIVSLGAKDIVRHPLVWKIVERYEGERGGKP